MNTLASSQNIHQGETIIVCGCGESLNELARPARFITIGVNDVGRRSAPNYSPQVSIEAVRLSVCGPGDAGAP